MELAIVFLYVFFSELIELLIANSNKTIQKSSKIIFDSNIASYLRCTIIILLGMFDILYRVWFVTLYFDLDFDIYLFMVWIVNLAIIIYLIFIFVVILLFTITTAPFVIELNNVIKNFLLLLIIESCLLLIISIFGGSNVRFISTFQIITIFSGFFILRLVFDSNFICSNL